MAKPKEEKPGDLEIISIGTIYDGPWDKKYWSSSRGKDRYPYPVGYRAVRTHNGIIYKMEILESLKGPLFTISSTDGQSCSGQTPDIAWEGFQKKGCARIKLWQGKRFSCKIDGVEFFGFKNPFVQRLLRELVANVSGTAEQSSLSSSFCNGASKTKHHTQCTEFCTHIDLLQHLAKPQVTGKRSRKHKNINVKSNCKASIKRLRPQDQKQNADASNFGLRNQRNNKSMNSSNSLASNEEHGICNNPVNLETVFEEENNLLPAEDGLCFGSFESSANLKEEGQLPQEERNLTSSKSFLVTEEAGNLFKDTEPLGRSKVTKTLGFSSSKPIKEGEISVPDGSEAINNVDLCAPDTFDQPLDYNFNSVLDSPKESSYYVKDELIAAHMVISDEMVTESHSEGEMFTSSANAGSEKGDFDSVGHEIANSMMTLLLPRALPLIKTFSRKKTATSNTSEISSHGMKSQVENNRTNLSVDAAFPAGLLTENFNVERQKEMMQILSMDLGSGVPSCGDITSIVPDSFENDVSEIPVSNQLPMFPDAAEADLTTLCQDTCSPETARLPDRVDALQGSAVRHVEASDSKLNFCHEVHSALNEGPQKGDNIISNSALGCICPSKKEMCVNSNENSICLEIHSEQKDVKPYPGCTEANICTTDAKLTGMKSSIQIPQKESSVKTGGAGTGSMSFTQIPDTTSVERQCHTPLSESIICRNFIDFCAPETCITTKTLLASDNHKVRSDRSPIKTDLFVDEARLGGQPHKCFIGKNSIDSEGEFCNMALVTSQNQEFVGASNYNDALHLFDPSISCEEKSKSYEKELLRRQELVACDGSAPWLQDQGANFCDDLTENKENKDSSFLNNQTNVKCNNELEGVLELLGFFVHPMPISLVLLSTKGNEVYICVLCGFSMDKERTLFIYKSPINRKRMECPSFIGHASIMLPVSRDAYGREVALDSSGLQFTPDGQSLVLLNSIKAPYCREGIINCPCSACTSDCLEKTSVKIVQVKPGYVSVVVKLKATDNVCCILVCEPSYLVAAEESGRLHLWVMNSTWSAQTEECYLPTSDRMPHYIVELKKIPKCAALVVGHNGCGEFSLWDISNRILVSRFSAPGTSVFQFLPISLFRWQSKGLVPVGHDVEDHINDIMEEAKIYFPEEGENHAFLPTEGEDLAIWLLVSTLSDPDVQSGYQSSDSQVNPVGRWRLALLVKNMVILGNALDPRAAAIGTSAGHGIIGTSDGLVYMWELSTGSKLGNVHYFKDAEVSCIATDDSSSGALAVAGDGGQLQLYLHSRKASTNQKGD